MNIQSEFKIGRENSIEIFKILGRDTDLKELKRKARASKGFSFERLTRAYWLGRARGHGDLRRKLKMERAGA